jgi:hypothetical protein
MRLGSLESHGSVTPDRTLPGAGKCRIRRGVRVLLPGPHQSLNLRFIKRHDHVSVTGRCRCPVVVSRDNLYVPQRIAIFTLKTWSK